MCIYTYIWMDENQEAKGSGFGGQAWVHRIYNPM